MMGRDRGSSGRAAAAHRASGGMAAWQWGGASYRVGSLGLLELAVLLERIVSGTLHGRSEACSVRCGAEGRGRRPVEGTSYGGGRGRVALKTKSNTRRGGGRSRRGAGQGG